MTSHGVTYEQLFAVMARASCGRIGDRIAVAPEAAVDDPMTRLGIALNVLLDDLEYRRRQAESNLHDLLEERTRRLQELDAAVNQREEFISIAAHELYTPLTSLQLVLQGLSKGVVGNTPGQLRRLVELAERQTRKLSSLIDSLLSIGRSRSPSPMLLRLEPLDLAVIAHDAAELFAADLQRSASRLSILAAAPVEGRWDRYRLEQVLSNLLGNAIKFGAGKPIEVSVTAHDGTARLVVRDHGIGIPPDRLPRIFERFERGVSSARYGGLGLGLFIVQEIVRAHGGSVRAESVPGEGATFTLELPCAGPPSEGDRG